MQANVAQFCVRIRIAKHTPMLCCLLWFGSGKCCHYSLCPSEQHALASVPIKVHRRIRVIGHRDILRNDDKITTKQHISALFAFNSSLPQQIGRYFADDISICIFINEKCCCNFSSNFTEFVPNGPFDNKTILVQVIAWHRTCDEPLPGPMLTQFNNAYMRQWGEMG